MMVKQSRHYLIEGSRTYKVGDLTVGKKMEKYCNKYILPQIRATWPWGVNFSHILLVIGCCQTATFMGHKKNKQNFLFWFYSMSGCAFFAYNMTYKYENPYGKYLMFKMCPLKVVVRQWQNQNKSNRHTPSSQIALPQMLKSMVFETFSKHSISFFEALFSGF